MTKAVSTRTIHPFYTPLKRVNRRVITTSKTNETATATQDEKESPPKKRKPSHKWSGSSKKITLKRKKKISESITDVVIYNEDSHYDNTVELREYWLELYEKSMGVPYAIGTVAKQLSLCDLILERLKTQEKSKTFMRMLLTHPDLDWVGQKTLDFLSKPSNQSRIAPLTKKRKRSSRAEYAGERTTETKITFKSI